MARKKAGWKVRVARTGGALVLIMALVWWWIPWEYDLFPKTPPNPNERVDPDTKRLFAKGTRILVVTAHPDDAEFYLGGTLPQLKASGAELSLVVCTDGDKSYYGPFTDVAYNRRVRREEQTAAAKRWGATDIVYLGFPDGRLTDSDDVTNAIVKQIERLKPDYVFAFDGEYPPRRSHQDHRRAGETATRAVARASHKPDWLLHFSTSAPNHAFDVTKTWDEKEALMKTHASQFVVARNDIGNRLVGRTGDPWPMIQALVYDSAEETGVTFGFDLAEGVRVVGIRGR